MPCSLRNTCVWCHNNKERTGGCLIPRYRRSHSDSVSFTCLPSNGTWSVRESRVELKNAVTQPWPRCHLWKAGCVSHSLGEAVNIAGNLLELHPQFPAGGLSALGTADHRDLFAQRVLWHLSLLKSGSFMQQKVLFIKVKFTFKILKFNLTDRGRKSESPGYTWALIFPPGNVPNGQGYEGNSTLTSAGGVTVLPEFKPIIAKCLGRASVWSLLALEISFASEADCEWRVH